MTLSTQKFNTVICSLEDLSEEQTLSVLLQILSVGTENTNRVQETIACLNSLKEDEILIVLKELKNQFSEEDWEIILNILLKNDTL